VDEIAAKITTALGNDNIKVDNWKAQNEQLLSGLQGQSISSIMIQVFVLISVVLGIASVLVITVIQKSRQIGILKAMGIKNSSTSYIFLFEGLILGFFGAILGILFGLGLAFAFTKFALNPDGTPVIALYISYPFIAISGLIAIGSSILAALMPAIRSSKLNPIDIIRNN
jgi:lipoprotein-releasing system permease protein